MTSELQDAFAFQEKIHDSEMFHVLYNSMRHCDT